MSTNVKLMACFLFAGLFWILPPPEGLTLQGWHLLGVFIACILGIIIKAQEMGCLVIYAMTALACTQTVPLQIMLDGYSNKAVWLVVLAFFIAKGFAVTGLGRRIAYSFVFLLGRRTLGLSYGLLATDVLIAPAIPSATARCGGILYPVVQGIAKAFNSSPNSVSAQRLGGFLTLTTFHGTVITSAMFLTAMAANPIIASYALKEGVELSWGLWAQAASLPGLCSLVLVPYFIYLLHPPELKRIPDAPELARRQLQDMGRIGFQEGVMFLSLILLLVLWALPSVFGLNATLSAFVGISLLLLTRVLSWRDLLEERPAWNAFIWFGGLVVLAKSLNQLGVITWISEGLLPCFTNVSWVWALAVLGLFYFYVHYLFASSLAHVSALFPALLGLLVALGAPPLLVALVLGFSSSLYSGLTHYSFGPAPILFGAGFVQIQKWWQVGFLVSVANIIIWLAVGLPWWQFLGLVH